MTDDDLPIFYAHANDPEAIRMAAFTVEDPSDRAVFDARWARFRQDPAIVARTVVGGDGEVVGHASVFGPAGEREITYWIGREHWGRGVATAALRELLRVVPERPLRARAAADNAGSIRVLQKCGFVVTGTARGFANGRGEEIDEVILTLAPVEKVNVFGAVLDERLDEESFRHGAASVAGRLGASRTGASIYDAEPGLPIWPYHYHHGVEEWLYVIAGAPVLREPAGERVLAPGDLVCFPSGHLGAHTVKGPGRFAIFATGRTDGPWVSVYPDSDKVSGPAGILLRTSAVGYWHGEGTAGTPEPVEAVREPATAPPRPVVNALAGGPHARLGRLVGADRFDATVADLDPGAASDPYHYIYGREQWLLVLAGTATLRRPQGERQLDPGDLVCFPDGPAGAHRLSNRGDARLRTLSLSTTGVPANVCHPDTGGWVLHHGTEHAVELRE